MNSAGALDAHLNRRRRELGLRWRDLADRAGVSEETIRLLRKGMERERASTTDARVEDAVGWARGSIARVRTGGEPELQEPTVRVSGVWVEHDTPAYLDPAAVHAQDPHHEQEHDLEWWKADARYHDVDIDSPPPEGWDLDAPLELQLFMQPFLSWGAKKEIRVVQRAHVRAARAEAQQEREQAAANGGQHNA